MMTPNYLSATVLSNESVGKSIRRVIISKPEALSYEAGQFFLVRLKDSDNGEFVERSYSAANFGDPEKLEFVIRIEPHGRMSRLIDSLTVGSHLDLKGPFGRFGFADLTKPFERLVFIAGGVGISPLRSMIQKTFSDKDDYPLQLFYGFRTPEDYLFQEELESYADSDRFEVIPAISDEGDFEWSGLQGLIPDFLEGRVFEPSTTTHCFICGPPPMVKATRLRLFELGFQKDMVHVEAW